jgi:hypothetical protein
MILRMEPPRLKKKILLLLGNQKKSQKKKTRLILPTLESRIFEDVLHYAPNERT